MHLKSYLNLNYELYEYSMCSAPVVRPINYLANETILRKSEFINHLIFFLVTIGIRQCYISWHILTRNESKVFFLANIIDILRVWLQEQPTIDAFLIIFTVLVDYIWRTFQMHSRVVKPLKRTCIDALDHYVCII